MVASAAHWRGGPSLARLGGCTIWSSSESSESGIDLRSVCCIGLAMVESSRSRKEGSSLGGGRQAAAARWRAQLSFDGPEGTDGRTTPVAARRAAAACRAHRACLTGRELPVQARPQQVTGQGCLPSLSRRQMLLRIDPSACSSPRRPSDRRAPTSVLRLPSRPEPSECSRRQRGEVHDPSSLFESPVPSQTPIGRRPLHAR
jgi:hypothetical protein